MIEVISDVCGDYIVGDDAILKRSRTSAVALAQSPGRQDYSILDCVGRIAGNINIRPSTTEVDDPMLCIEVGYSLNEEFRGQGLAICALRTVLDYCEWLGEVKSVYARISPTNIASIRVAEEAGLVFVAELGRDEYYQLDLDVLESA